MPNDWTRPPLSDQPANLGSVLAASRLDSVERDRERRLVTLRFALPPEAGPPEAVFTVERVTHLLSFAYLPPFTPISQGLTPEEAMATVGEWAREGLIATDDPLSFETPLIVERAFLHVTQEASTLSVEGYGEDEGRLVWWEIRVSGAHVEAM